MDRSSLGKLIAVHTVSPVFQQRAAAVAGLAFVFFVAMMLAFYARGHFGYFLLSTAFLIVFAFTMAGWWIQRRNAVEVYDRGVAFKSFSAQWEEFETIERVSDGSLKLTTNGRTSALIPRTINAVDVLESHIREKCGGQSKSS